MHLALAKRLAFGMSLVLALLPGILVTLLGGGTATWMFHGWVAFHSYGTQVLPNGGGYRFWFWLWRHLGSLSLQIFCQ